MTFDFESLTEDDIIKKIDYFQVNHKNDFMIHIVKNQLIKAFYLAYEMYGFDNIYMICKDADILDDLRKFCQMNDFITSHKLSWLINMEIAEYLVEINYDFNHFFDIYDLDILQYLINNSNFDPKLTIKDCNRLNYSRRFEPFKYLRQNYDLKFPDHILFGLNNFEIMKFVLDQGFNFNFKQNNNYFVSTVEIKTIIEFFDQIVDNQYHLPDQGLLKAIYFRLIYSDIDKDYIERVYRRIDSFEGLDFPWKKTNLKLAINKTLNHPEYLQEILAKFTFSSGLIPIEYFRYYEVLRLVLNHSVDHYTIDDLSRKYLQIFDIVKLWAEVSSDQDEFKMLKLLIDYGAKPKLLMSKNQFMQKYATDNPVIEALATDIMFSDKSRRKGKK